MIGSAVDACGTACAARSSKIEFGEEALKFDSSIAGLALAPDDRGYSPLICGGGRGEQTGVARTMLGLCGRTPSWLMKCGGDE